MFLIKIFNDKIELNKNEKAELKEVAFKTWLYFDTLLTDENNYLIPDNFQVNREEKEDIKTSPTDIAMSLTAIVSAHSLEFVDARKAVRLIEKIIASIESLEKWNGHLYNWYNIRTLEPLNPKFISTVDSGNFVGYMYVVLQFLENIEKEIDDKEKIKIMKQQISELIQNTDFTKLFDYKNNLFSVGFDVEENKIPNTTRPQQQRPTTTNKLKRFEPDTLLIASELLPARDAEIETAVSGSDVPIATIVKPMISDGTLNLFATFDAPSTKKSAPLIKSTNPATSTTAAHNISIINSPFPFHTRSIQNETHCIQNKSFKILGDCPKSFLKFCDQ